MKAKRPTRGRTVAGDLGAAFARAASEERAKAYPLVQYQPDPVRYVRERLKEPFIMPHQEAILRAVAAATAGEAPPRIAVRSGQKCGKTRSLIWEALHRYECFPGSRTFLAAAIVEQTSRVLWHELGEVLRAAEARGVVIDGKLAASPAGGFVSSDGSRGIHGVSGRDIEAIAGISGNIALLIDEASHLPQEKFEAFSGNTMGGGLIICTSNPTRNRGPFFDAFHTMQEHWQTFHVNAEDVARWQEETGIRIPFTATRERIEEFKAMLGDDSPFYIVRVRGDFLLNEEGAIFKLAATLEAVARWASAPADGRLSIGYDPAGPDPVHGDEHVWAIVRGSKCIRLHRRRGLSEEAALAETLALVSVNRDGDETPRVAVDSEGLGAAIYGRLKAEAESRLVRDRPNAFEVIGVKSSSRRVLDAARYGRVRAQLMADLATWIEGGGAIPDDTKLQAELSVPRWHLTSTSQLEPTGKEAIRDALGRSCDSLDALALAVHRPVSADAAVPMMPRPVATSPQQALDQLQRPQLSQSEIVRQYRTESPNIYKQMNPFRGGGRR